MYEIIEKNKYGVLVKNTTNYGDCFFCKYGITQCNNRYKCINDSYYLPDSEVEGLEVEANLKAKIEELESRITELEEQKTTELIIEKEDYYGCLTNITKTKCCGIAPITNENFCPNCGRKIIRK